MMRRWIERAGWCAAAVAIPFLPLIGNGLLDLFWWLKD